MVQHRLSARVEFSPAAEKLYLEAKNKTEFILQAIEFYAQHGKPIYDDLQEIKRLLRQDDIQEIKQLLYEMKDKGIAVTALPPGTSVNTEMQGGEAVEKEAGPGEEMSDEERQLHQGIMSTLGAFLGGGEEE
ncbi:hypothetical protein [Paenibacillus validus]|uniref:hypothetical protein n=1 Tax=Paenibacillus validus TaxID=44253 RepID=UPI003D2A13AD